MLILGCFGLALFLFVLLVISAEKARFAAAKYGGRAPYFWWLYGRHLDRIQYGVIGPIQCLFRGHKPWKIFMWGMSGPGEGYTYGCCSRCYGMHNVEHPIPMSDQEQLAWLEDHHPDARIVHLGEHSWSCAHSKKGDILRVISTTGNVTSTKPPEYGGPPTGRMDCFFYDLLPDRDGKS